MKNPSVPLTAIKVNLADVGNLMDTTLVYLSGLKDDSNLNGRVGHIRLLDLEAIQAEDSPRFHVEVHSPSSASKVIGVKPENLTFSSLKCTRRRLKRKCEWVQPAPLTRQTELRFGS